MNKVSEHLPTLDKGQSVRVASGAIRGYLYQFEKTVLEILRSDDCASIRVEGIEDIDISSVGGITAVQIKYLESNNSFTNKSVAEPLFEMLKTIKENPEITFKLYVHFGGESAKIPEKMSEDAIRDALNSKKISGNPEKKKVVETLAGYVKKLSKQLVIEEGSSLQSQRSELGFELEKQMHCGHDEAVLLHLPRAVQIINTIACNHDEKGRVISKGDLLRQLGVQPRLFASWFNKYLDSSYLIQYLTSWMINARFNERKLHRCMVVNLTAATTRSSADLIEVLSQDLSDGQALTSATPWTVVAESDEKTYLELKKELAERGVLFNDGYESFSFNRTIFVAEPILSRVANGQRIDKASFNVRLVSMATLKEKGWLCNGYRVVAFGALNSLAELRVEPTVAVEGLSIDNITELIRKVRKNG